jgi:Polysaccharide lyase
MADRKSRWVLISAAAVTALLIPGAVAIAGEVPSGPRPADVSAQSLLWAGDTGRTPAQNFDGLEQSPGSITVANPPVGSFGPSFRYETWDWSNGKERCESRGIRRPDGSVLNINDSMVGQTVYAGWRALWQPMPNASGKWLALFQLHISGPKSGEPSAGPYVLRTLGDGTLHFQYVTPNGTSRHIWNTPFRTGAWQTFVIGFKVSRGNDGWTSFWYNGVQQKFTDGSTQFKGPTLMGSHVNLKWGVYRSGPNSGHAVAWVNRPRFGTTYEDVAPPAA